MGVRGLEGYLDHNSKAAYHVNINNRIHNYRKHNKGKKPVIIVDGSAAMRHLYDGKQLSWLTGGQMKEYENTVKKFISSFKNAELVFFFDGPQMDAKMSMIYQRRKGKVKKIHKLFKDIKNGSHFKKEEATNLYFPDNTEFILKYVAKKYGCKVINACEECDMEIVRYARQNRCMAVLSQDTDYIIFQSAEYYWSAKYLNVHQMRTLNYDREGLASSLGIRSDSLPLLASLLGNDLVPKEALMKFHKSISSGKKSNFSNLISDIAAFIRHIPIENCKIDSADLKALASKVFNDETKYILLQESVQSYDPDVDKSTSVSSSTDDKWGEMMEKIHLRYREDFISSIIYTILSKKRYSCGVCFEDYSENDLPPSQKMLRPLREKLYGLLLYEHPGECKVEEWVIYSSDNKKEFEFVEAVKPKVNHPGLLSLWASPNEHQWNLIGEICDVDAAELKSLPSTLMIPALSLKYLCSNVNLENDEVRSLVAGTVLVELYNSTNQEIKFIQDFSTRALRLYALLTKTFCFMIELFNGVGNPIEPEEITPSNYQNGDLFYLKYIQATKKHLSDANLCEDNETYLKKYKMLMEFVTKKNESS